ncbi:unnamed protein product, partial [marine sediment metagenome]
RWVRDYYKMKIDLQKIINKRGVRCPFYGFHGVAGIFMDSNGNQCPLRDGYAPCYYKIIGEKPDWSKCEFNSQISLDDFESFEISIHGVNSMILFKDWVTQVLGK